MQKRSGCLVVMGMVVLAGGVVAVSLATRRAPLLTRSLGQLASSVAAWASSAAPPVSTSPDAGPRPNADAGAPLRRQTAPLSSAQLGAPLVHGAFVSACGAPERMKVVVNATVRLGRAVNVAVTTEPPDSVVASCIERTIRAMQWDVSPKTDRVTVTY
jgi:hypothetical protein